MNNSYTTRDASRGFRVRRLRPVLAPALVTVCLVGCERREPDIDPASVERVVTTLSADDMLGRAAFTLAIDKAADFIRAEFISIGLEVIDGLDDYLQRFMVYRLEVQSRRVVVNGVEIPSERSAVEAGAPSVRWTTGDPVEVVVIGPEDNPGGPDGRIRSIRGRGRNTLVLMSTRHQAFFRRWADELSAPEFFLDPPSRATLVYVLTDEARIESYEVEVAAPLEKLPLTNVVGVIPGRRDNEVVLFGGHYDAFGILEPVDGDSIANGANDCASGTTGMIELARYFKAKGRPERTLIFAAFTAHERMPYLGAEYLARQLDPDEVVAMFSIANIGRVHPEGPNTAIITGFERSDFGTILQRAVEGTPYSFHPDPYVRRTLFRRSDNVPFARRGVPAHGIGTAGAAEDQHTVSDEVGTLDLMNMTEVIRAIALGAAPIVSGEATPTRIAPPLRPE
jgi:hypothetical protein